MNPRMNRFRYDKIILSLLLVSDPDYTRRLKPGSGQESAGVPVRLCMSAGVSSCGMLGRACAPTGEVKWGAHTLLQEP